MHVQRQPSACGQHSRHGLGGPAVTPVQLTDRGDGRAVQPTEYELSVAPWPCTGRPGTHRRSAPASTSTTRQLSDRRQGRRVGKVEVVQHGQHRLVPSPRGQMLGGRHGQAVGPDGDIRDRRTLTAQCGVEQQARSDVSMIAPRVEHDTAHRDAVGQLGGQTGLSGSVRSHHRHEATRSAQAVRPPREQRRHVAVRPTNKDPEASRAGGTTRRPRWRGADSKATSWSRMAASRWRSPGPGSTPISSISTRRAPLVRGQCLRLSTEPVEAEDQLLPEPFPERVLGDQRLELGDKGRVDPWSIRSRVDAHLGGGDPQPVEASTLLGADCHVVEPFERAAAPPPERRTKLSNPRRSSSARDGGAPRIAVHRPAGDRRRAGSRALT